jgi:hypothetical protein
MKDKPNTDSQDPPSNGAAHPVEGPAKIVPAGPTDKQSLSDTEQKALIQHEKIISEGLSKFLDVAIALREIREKNLYRETGWTFEEYCEHRFGISRQMGARWVKSAVIAEKIQPHQGLLPSRESQFRELAIAAPEKRQEAWVKSVEEAGGKDPTAEIIRKCSEPLKKQRTAGGAARKSKGKVVSGEIPQAKVEKESDNAFTAADAVVTFLRGGAVKVLDNTRKRDWKKILDDIARLRKAAGV